MNDGLAASYRYCRALHRAHGRSYYLATRLLPADRRPHVHALYGFMRYTDDIVDRVGGPPGERAAGLRRWTALVTRALAGDVPADGVLPALVHTVGACGLDRAELAAFLRAMQQDLTVTRYATYPDLLDYMAGSAAAVGSLMLPILGTEDPVHAARPARELGLAFQLTNFLRDVGEDLDRGRIYLPQEDLRRFGVSVPALQRRVATGPIRDLIAFEVDRATRHYALAAPGIALLAPGSQACIRAAYRLYGGILDEIVRARYDVFTRRAVVPDRRRLAMVAASLLGPASRPLAVPGRYPVAA